MKDSQKFKNISSIFVLGGIIAGTIITLTVDWRVSVAWLGMWSFGFAFAANECSKDAEKDEKDK